MVSIILARLGEGTCPEVVRVGANVYVTYQDNDGSWSYSINGRCVCRIGGSRDECARAMRNHAAQAIYAHVNFSPTGDYRQAAALVDHRDRYGFARWWAWHDRYNAGRREGLDDVAARAVADAE